MQTNSVSNTSTTTASSATAATSATSSKSDAGSADRFLKLLVAQLQNQDPLNPMDNAQVTSQMAQIQTVEGINSLNASITSMATSFADGQSLQAASLVGHNVLVAGKTLDVANGKAQGGYELTDAADQVTVSVMDKAGKLIDSLDLGPQKAGVQTFDWKASGYDNQSFTFSVTAMQNGRSTAVDSLSLQRITGVSRTDAGTNLFLGQSGSVNLSNVKQIL